MTAAHPGEPPRLQPEDLLDVLRPRVLLPALVASGAFGLLCLYAHAGRWLLLGVVAGGSLLAMLSPTWGFALCIFLFAFRNDAFSAGELKIADPLFAVTALSWCAHALHARRLRWHWVFLPVGLFVCTSLLSGLMALYPDRFVLDVIRLLYLVLILVLGVQVMATREALLRGVKAFLAAGLVMAMCSVLGLVAKYVLHGTGVPFADSGGRLGFQSIAVDPLRVPSFLLFPLLVAAALEQRGRNRYERWTAAGLVWLGIAASLLSVSRSAVLQLLPGLLVMWWLTRHHFRKLALLVTATALVVGFLSLSSLPPEIIKQYRLDRYALAGQAAAGHSEPRLVIWAAALKAFQSSPWLGVGLDNFKSRYFEFRDPWLARGWLYWNTKGSHSAYLAQLAETGVLGSATFLALLVSYLVLGRRLLGRARSQGNLAQYTLLAAGYGAYVGQLVAGLALELFAHNHVWVLMVFLTVLDTPAVPSPAPVTLASAAPDGCAPAEVSVSCG